MMRKNQKNNILIAILIGVSFLLILSSQPVDAEEFLPNQNFLIGKVADNQGSPVIDADVTLLDQGGNSISEALTQSNGIFTLPMPNVFSNDLTVKIERHHFEELLVVVDNSDQQLLQAGNTVSIEDQVMVRVINIGFWVATGIFIVVLALIATGKLHTTLSALIGASLIYLVSYIGRPFLEDIYIFNFERSLQYIDWNVIFLVMGMMIVIAIVEHTGIFQWMAFFAYRTSRGKMWLLLPILMLFTGIASAFLDNVTTMLLMTPMTVQIAIALGISPLALLIPEVMASNVIGVSTLVGTPTNILIGSFGNISFNDFLSNLTPGVLVSFIGLTIYSWFIYRNNLKKAHKPTPVLMEKLAERGKITQPDNLKKVGWVGLGMIVLFVIGESIHLLPAVTALMGATALLVWIKPNIEEMIEAVDWTTLVFFMSLFIVVGGIQEVGLISFIAENIGNFVGDSLVLSMLAVIWVSAFLSMAIANIPFTAAMLPVIGYLTATVPGAESKVLFFCLSVGAAMGGNGTLIGASANMVMAGIAEAAGYKISYADFFKKGFPEVLITVSIGTVWLFIKFVL